MGSHFAQNPPPTPVLYSAVINPFLGYVQTKNNPNPTPFPSLILKVGKMKYSLGKMDCDWSKCLKSGQNFPRSEEKKNFIFATMFAWDWRIPLVWRRTFLCCAGPPSRSLEALSLANEAGSCQELCLSSRQSSWLPSSLQLWAGGGEHARRSQSSESTYAQLVDMMSRIVLPQ